MLVSASLSQSWCINARSTPRRRIYGRIRLGSRSETLHSVWIILPASIRLSLARDGARHRAGGDAAVALAQQLQIMHTLVILPTSMHSFGVRWRTASSGWRRRCRGCTRWRKAAPPSAPVSMPGKVLPRHLRRRSLTTQVPARDIIVQYSYRGLGPQLATLVQVAAARLCRAEHAALPVCACLRLGCESALGCMVMQHAWVRLSGCQNSLHPQDILSLRRPTSSRRWQHTTPSWRPAARSTAPQCPS